MKHVIALAIKGIASLALLYLILGMMYGMSFGNVLFITLVLGMVAYIIGDMLILPRTNNLVASFADFGLALMVIWLMSSVLTNGGNLFSMSLVASLGVALFEFFYHKYISNNVINNSQASQNYSGNMRFQTEASEELIPNREEIKNRRDDK
ncbi:YndM family protein [Cytobacillus massiliigabonensis]|uniref:YndM family protein n=1 Tax=Cytobacillus massiliigabonensis TaxID=1871011 RepID=UPI000C8332FE|nr:YndM family protein [Cytobacillus massiliigabonensis]